MCREGNNMHLRLFLAFAICLLSLSSCSRESSISENVSLRNNHSVVFASKTPFKDPQAFADSITNLANPDSVIAHDTLTVTVNDTIYLMGFLKYNADKIYRYAWSFINPDSTMVSKNATQEKWVFTKPSGKDINCPSMKSKLYCPLFIAVDGNNARDTAGKDQFIRVIDTPPYLTVPKDTLWTRAKSSITFPIVALDSFGTITSIKVDLDASKKDKAKDWKVEKKDGSDTMLVTIAFDSTKVDSIGNQKIYIIAIDDDDNETLDSVNLHFNQLPTLELLDPKDDGRYDNSERFAFFYKASDADNPGSLRYNIRVAKSRDNYGTPPVLTDNDLIAKDIKDKSYEPKAEEFNDSNVIVTLKNPKTILSGKLFWDVWVTDGYDTVYSALIKEKDGTLRPWKFFYGNLKDTTGNFMGYVKYEGWTHHSGIRIVFQDTLGNRKYTHTADDGSFSITVKSGIYEMIAMDTTGYGFKDTIATDLFVDVSSDKDLGTMILRDTANPVIVFSDKPDDTISVTSLTLNGKFYDHGSQVEKSIATLDGDTLTFSSFSQNTWVVDLDSMDDGMHEFFIFAQDSAGNKSDTTINFLVQSTSIHIAVNNLNTVLQQDDQPYKFTAEVSQTSLADSLIWVSNVPGFKQQSHKLDNFKDTLDFSDASKIGNMESGQFYEMYAMTPNGVKSNVIRFGVLGNNPVIYFEKPTNDTTITINDKIYFSVYFYAGKGGTGSPTIKTVGDGCNRYFNDGFKLSPEEESIHWEKAGQKKIIVSFSDGSNTVNDTLRVNVIEDPPTIKILNKQNNTRKRINTTDKVQIKAYDKFGTVQEIKWTCSNNPITFDNAVTITPADTVTEEIEFTMPGSEASNYKCIVRATDDDGVFGYDTITYNVLQSKPVLDLFTQKETITINDDINLNGDEKNIFNDGTEDNATKIVDRMFYCDSSMKNLASISDEKWTHISKLDTNITAPDKPCTWYCVVKIDNSESASARDTATYTVLLDPPWVNVSEDQKSVTIKDTVSLDARSGDGMGKIVKYEWGCGTKGSSINYKWSSTSTPHQNVVMPDAADKDYRCVIRVTDDDGNTATDTTHIEVVLAPPSVTVLYKNITTRSNFKINLDADAKDADNYDGEIVKREWSCGEPSEIQNHWKTVSTFDTSWKAPSNNPKQYYCIARATDDDGNTAMDTSYVSFTTEIPTLAVKTPIIYINLGEPFDLDAYINDAWQGVNWFNWQCFNESGKAMESSKNWAYKGSFYDVRLDTTSYIRDPSKLNNIDTLFCVISAQEASSDSVFHDTTKVKIMRQHPKGVISAADTVYLWSGDETVDNNAKYFYTNEWGGFNSKPGELGDPKKKYEYRWSFSNIGSAFYTGNDDGSLDTSSYEFNEAFRRPTSEGSLVISLDFRDSIAPDNATRAFYARHTGDTVSRTVYFRKAWQNLASNNDTVIVKSMMRTGPSLTTLGNKPFIAYLTAKTTVETRYLSGTSWKTLNASAVTASDSIIKIQLANNGTNLYMGVLTKDNVLTIYQSTSGTSAWAKVGNNISCNASFDLMTKSSGPQVLYINTDETPYYATLSNSSWTKKQISTKKSRLITGAFTSSGSWVAVYIDNTSNYQGYYAIYDSGNNNKAKDKSLSSNMNMPKLSIDQSNNVAYLAFLNRDTEKYGPYIYKGTVNTSDVSWNKSGDLHGKSITPGRFAYRIDVTAKDGKLFTIFDDASANSSAQSHVYQMGSSKWSLYGENELPYFKAEFYSFHNYYLRGAFPNIAIDDNGDVYISMLAWENGTGGGGRNFGPIVMKYAAKNWLVNDK